MNIDNIIAQLPYSKPFLFVDALEKVSEKGVIGSYTFREDEVFYSGHFKDFPVTPGVILTECMAQIGLVCLGIYLQMKLHSITENLNAFNVALASSEVEFFKPVFPKEKVMVTSEMIYFRFNKLKCNVKMVNSKGELVCKGILSAMVLNEVERN